jgi:hypothetical protein
LPSAGRLNPKGVELPIDQRPLDFSPANVLHRADKPNVVLTACAEFRHFGS